MANDDCGAVINVGLSPIAAELKQISKYLRLLCEMYAMSSENDNVKKIWKENYQR